MPKMQNIGRRKAGKYFYTVYLVAKTSIPAAKKELREMYRTVIAKEAGGGYKQKFTHYAVWCRGRK